MNKEIKILIERLNRIFPQMKMIIESSEFNETNCSPEYQIDWFEFLEELNKNGLRITNKK